MSNFNKIGFIGFGNMGQALARGLIDKKVVLPDNIYACAKNYEKLKNNASKLGINSCVTIDEVLAKADTIIVAIKPFLIKEVMGKYVDELQRKLIVSLAANFTYKDYKDFLGNKSKIICAIPNTPIAVGNGIMICEEVNDLNANEIEEFQSFFGKVALVKILPTSQMGVAGVIAGCGPAFGAMFIEALGDAGVMEGLSRENAYDLASKMLLGTASLQLEKKIHPGIMKDQVCSPKGTTIQGVRILEEKGFRSGIIEAVAHICNK